MKNLLSASLVALLVSFSTPARADFWDFLPGVGGADTPEVALPGGAKFTVGFRAGGSAEVEVTGEHGEYRTIRIETTYAVTAGLGRDAGPVGLGASGSVGNEVSYEVTLPVEQAEAIARGEQPLPDPRDPSTWRPNQAIVLDETAVASFEVGAAFRGITGSMTETWGEGDSLSVVVLPGGRAQVTAGPTELVRHEVFLGLGNLDYRFGVKVGSTNTVGHLTRVTLDVGTPAGRTAFDRFVNDGIAPADPNRETIDYVRSESELGLHASLKAYSWDFSIAETGGEFRVTTHADGRKTVEAIYTVGDDVKAVVTHRFEADGTERGDLLEVRLTMPLSEWEDASLETAFSGNHDRLPSVRGADSATIVLRGDEWIAFRDELARSSMLGSLSGSPSPEHLMIALAHKADGGLPDWLAMTAVIDRDTIDTLPGRVEYHGVDQPGAPVIAGDGAGTNVARNANTLPSDASGPDGGGGGGGQVR